MTTRASSSCSCSSAQSLADLQAEHHSTTDRLRAENERLLEALRVSENARRFGDALAGEFKGRASAQIASLEASSARLGEALRTYGQHKAGCSARGNFPTWPVARRCQNGNVGCDTDHGVETRCDCGFAEALAGLSGEP